MQFLCAFLLSHLFDLAVTLWLTRICGDRLYHGRRPGPGRLALAQPIACLVASTLVYLIAYEGLRRGLEQFPWKPRKLIRSEYRLDKPRVWHDEPCGWPYDRMMRETLIDRGISRIDVVLCCVHWDLVAFRPLLVHRRSVRSGSVSLPSMFLFLVIDHVLLQAPHLSTEDIIVRSRFGAESWTFRWIIPGYDHVFLAPICTILAGLLSFVLLQAGRLSSRCLCSLSRRE